MLRKYSKSLTKLAINSMFHKFRNEKGDITADTKEIQRIVRFYCKNLYSTKLGNIKEIDDILYRYLLPKLNIDQANNLNKPIPTKEIEAFIKNLPMPPPGPIGFITEFYQIFKAELILNPTQIIPQNRNR